MATDLDVRPDDQSSREKLSRREAILSTEWHRLYYVTCDEHEELVNRVKSNLRFVLGSKGAEHYIQNEWQITGPDSPIIDELRSVVSHSHWCSRRFRYTHAAKAAFSNAIIWWAKKNDYKTIHDYFSNNLAYGGRNQSAVEAYVSRSLDLIVNVTALAELRSSIRATCVEKERNIMKRILPFSEKLSKREEKTLKNIERSFNRGELIKISSELSEKIERISSHYLRIIDETEKWNNLQDQRMRIHEGKDFKPNRQEMQIRRWRELKNEVNSQIEKKHQIFKKQLDEYDEERKQNQPRQQTYKIGQKNSDLAAGRRDSRPSPTMPPHRPRVDCPGAARVPDRRRAGRGRRA